MILTIHYSFLPYLLKHLNETNISEYVYYKTTHDLFHIRFSDEEISIVNKIKIKAHNEWSNHFCEFCFYKLISDNLSEKYGDYCPNLDCSFLKSPHICKS